MWFKQFLKRLLVACIILIYAIVLFTGISIFLAWIFFGFHMLDHFIAIVEDLTNWAER